MPPRGYGGNKRLLKKYFHYYSENLVNRGFAHMGDGLQMAVEIGAATEGLGTIISMGPLFPWSTSLTLLARRPNTVWVNNRGERFFDEGDVNVAYLGNAMDRQPEQTSYSLFDERIKQDFINQERSYLEDLMGDSKKRPNTIDEDLEAQVQKGRVKIAGSWEEIGQWIGAAHGVIESTIDEYNAAGDRGYDALFVKEREFLIPLRVSPYYAIKCQRGFDTTVGGVKINHRMEVLDKSDEPIPGLFAAGTNTGGWEADTYNYRLSGTAIGFAVNSGRIAGENAAEYVLKSK